jgi:hypothetical protein
MGTKENPGPYDAMAKAEPDEPYFTLLARDPDASTLIREWATRRYQRGERGDVTMEALGVADEMDKWAIKYNERPRAPTLPTDD